MDLNNIIHSKRSRISNKGPNDQSTNSSLNNSSNDNKTEITTEFEIIDNDSNSNLSSSTNSSATNSSATKKLKKNKPSSILTKQQLLQHNLSNEDIESLINQPNISTRSCNSSEIKDNDLNKFSSNDNKQIQNDSSDKSSNGLVKNDTNDELFDSLIGPIRETSLFDRFAFLLSFDEKQNSEESAGYSIPFNEEHLTKQIKSGRGLILDKYSLDDFEDLKVIS